MRRHLYFYTYVECPYREARAVLAGDPGAWLPAPARIQGAGHVVTLEAGRRLLDGASHRDALVRVYANSPASDDRSMLRGLSWRSIEHDELFPVFEGDLELSSLSDGLCQLSCTGSYRPPLSVVGAVGDRLFGHHVAEAVVRNFVLSTADRLTRAVLPV